MYQEKTRIVSKYTIFFLLATVLFAVYTRFLLVEYSQDHRLILKDGVIVFVISSILGTTLALILMYLLSSFGRKIMQFVVAKRKQIATLGVGWAFDQGTNFAFDFILYPFVIGYWGLKIGGGIMIVISVVLSIGLILFYDRTKKDWLGIEALKSIRDEDQKTRIGRIASWLMKKGDPVALIGLSIFYSEPVAITLYMRRGAYQFNGFSKRDWIIFTLSVIISNVSWALAVWGGLEAFQFLF